MVSNPSKTSTLLDQSALGSEAAVCVPAAVAKMLTELIEVIAPKTSEPPRPRTRRSERAAHRRDNSRDLARRTGDRDGRIGRFLRRAAAKVVVELSALVRVICDCTPFDTEPLMKPSSDSATQITTACRRRARRRWRRRSASGSASRQRQRIIAAEDQRLFAEHRRLKPTQAGLRPHVVETDAAYSASKSTEFQGRCPYRRRSNRRWSPPARRRDCPETRAAARRV